MRTAGIRSRYRIGLATALLLLSTSASLQPVQIEADNYSKLLKLRQRFGNYVYTGDTISWSVAKESAHLVKLQVSADGNSCKIIPTNNQNETKKSCYNCGDLLRVRSCNRAFGCAANIASAIFQQAANYGVCG